MPTRQTASTLTPSERLQALINPKFELAPNVKLEDPSTWIRLSRFTASDYSPEEGLPNWDLAEREPKTPQMIRSYLVLPTEKQVRSNTDIESLTRFIRDTAIRGQDEPCVVSKGENGFLQVSSGHRRRFASVNADQKFIPCLLRASTATSLDHFEDQVRGNEFRSELSPLDKARQYIGYLDRVQREIGVELSLIDGVNVLCSRFDLSPADAERYLSLAQAHPKVVKAVTSGTISIEDGFQIVRNSPEGDKAQQEEILTKFLNLLPGPKTIQKIAGKTRQDGSGKRGTRVWVHDEEVQIDVGGAHPIYLRVRSRDPEVSDEQIRKALEQYLRKFGISV